jgi:hypothetical protein
MTANNGLQWDIHGVAVLRHVFSRCARKAALRFGA